jgi:hypothetical protein
MVANIGINVHIGKFKKAIADKVLDYKDAIYLGFIDILVCTYSEESMKEIPVYPLDRSHSPLAVLLDIELEALNAGMAPRMAKNVSSLFRLFMDSCTESPPRTVSYSCTRGSDGTLLIYTKLNGIYVSFKFSY